MPLEDIIKRIITEEGLTYTEKARTIHTTCPNCGKNDKLSILKENGATICYRGKCQFKGWFHHWLALTARINIQEAKKRIYYKPFLYNRLHQKLSLQLDRKRLIDRQNINNINTLNIVDWPIYGTVEINSPAAFDGAQYLESRGIPLDIAQYYKIQYNTITRRIIFPIFINNTCYGWQGRAIDIVSEKDRIRNNTGFNRALLVMFLDNLKLAKHAIIAEGPIDAIKFHFVGGNIATMGKVITTQQIQLIKQYQPQKIFLALDEDAVPEMRRLCTQFDVPIYRVQVPNSCKKRCLQLNKKADFGECTFDECKRAVQNAQLITTDLLMTFLKSPQEKIKEHIIKGEFK